MAKKTKKSVEESMNSWSEGLDKIFEEKRKVDVLLSPSRGQIRYIKDYSKSIAERGAQIATFSEMAHAQIISFEKAQELIDFQRKELLRDLKYMQVYLEDTEEDE